MIVKRITEKTNLQNECKHKLVILFYQLSSVYSLIGFRKEALNYINYWFTIVTKTENFQQLDFNSVNQIMSSTELNISSELEVFKASDFWLSCESFDRSKYATKLFLKTRFLLLSDYVTKSLLEQNKDSNISFHKSKECLVLIEEVLKNKEEFYRNKSTIYYTNRYFKSSKYNITCGGFNPYSFKRDMSIYNFVADNLKKFKKYTPGKKCKTYGAVCIRNELYFLSCNKDHVNNKKTLFVKHSLVLKT